MPSSLQHWTLTLTEITGPTRCGPQYAHWVDAKGRRYACFLGLGVRAVANRYPLHAGEVWEVAGRPMESGPAEQNFDLDVLVRLVRRDPMSPVQSPEPVFLPPAVRTPNNTRQA